MGKIHRDEMQKGSCKGLGKGEMVGKLLNGYKISFRVMERFELYRSDD